MKNEIVSQELSIEKKIESEILEIRGQQVMIDRDLAELYCVETKRLNEQVRRNIYRFPKDFCFQLNDAETKELVANCDRFNILMPTLSLNHSFKVRKKKSF